MKILPDAQPPTQLVETSSWLISRTTAISPALLNQLKPITDASKNISGQSKQFIPSRGQVGLARNPVMASFVYRYTSWRPGKDFTSDRF